MSLLRVTTRIASRGQGTHSQSEPRLVIPLPWPENDWQMGLWPRSGRRTEHRLEECLELLPHRKTPKEGKHPLPLSGLCLPLCEAVLVPGPAEAFLRWGKTSPHAKDGRTEGQKTWKLLMTPSHQWINQPWKWPPSRSHYVTQDVFLLFMPLLVGFYVTHHKNNPDTISWSETSRFQNNTYRLACKN